MLITFVEKPRCLLLPLAVLWLGVSHMAFASYLIRAFNEGRKRDREKLWEKHDALELQKKRPISEKTYFAAYVARLRSREAALDEKIAKETDQKVLRYWQEQRHELLSYIQDGEKRIQENEQQIMSLQARKDGIRDEIESITRSLCQQSVLYGGYGFC